MPCYYPVCRDGIGVSQGSMENELWLSICWVSQNSNFISETNASVQNNRLLTHTNVQCLFPLSREQARQKKKKYHKTKTTKVLSWTNHQSTLLDSPAVSGLWLHSTLNCFVPVPVSAISPFKACCLLSSKSTL